MRWNSNNTVEVLIILGCRIYRGCYYNLGLVNCVVRSISVIIDPLSYYGRRISLSFDVTCMTQIYRTVIFRRVFHLRYLSKSIV